LITTADPPSRKFPGIGGQNFQRQIFPADDISGRAVEISYCIR